MDSLCHHVVATSYADLSQDECLHITALRYITEEIDAVHIISPDLDFRGDCESLVAIMIHVTKKIQIMPTMQL